MQKAMRPLVLLLVLSGCGASAAPSGPGPAPRTATPLQVPEGVAANRRLPAHAAFAHLVSAARALDNENRAESSRRCLLAGAGPFELAADIAVAVRPLPDPPEDLDARLDAAGPVRVLTRWTAAGARPDEARMGLVAFTTTPPHGSDGLVLFITDRGVRMHSLSSGAMGPSIALRDLRQQLAGRLRGGRGPLFVTAEAGVPLSTLRDVLAALPPGASGRVALAVPLTADTRLPAAVAPESADDGTGLCPVGLDDVDGATGVLSVQQLLGALGPLRAGAQRCLASTTGAAASGGRVVVALRIVADGSVSEACLLEDEVGSPSLRRCLLDSARSTRFPAPNPGGTVDVELPLALAPDDSLGQRPLCD